MKINYEILKRLNKYSKNLLLISSILYIFTIVVYLIILIFQKELIPFAFEQSLTPQFIFPIINLFGVFTGFIMLIIFSCSMLFRRQMNESYIVELIALVVVSLFNIIFPILMNSLATELALLNSVEYYLWFNRLTVLLGFTKFLIPFSLLTFYIGVTMRISLKLIYANKID